MLLCWGLTDEPSRGSMHPGRGRRDRRDRQLSQKPLDISRCSYWGFQYSVFSLDLRAQQIYRVQLLGHLLRKDLIEST